MKKILLLLLNCISFSSYAQSNIIVSEKFIDNRNQWDVGKEQNEISFIQYGRYNIKVLDNKNWHWFGRNIVISKYNDLTIRTTIVQSKRNSDHDLTGLLWNGTDDLSSIYLFQIDTKVGQYSIGKYQNYKYSAIKDWFPSDFLNSKRLEIEIKKKGNYYSFYINQNYLTTQKIEGNTGNNFGYFGGPNSDFWVEDLNIIREDSTLPNSQTDLIGSRYVNLNSACSYDRNINDKTVLITQPKDETKSLIGQIFEYSGLYTPIEIYGISTDDIGISFILNDKRYILINEKLLSGLKKSDKNYWGNLSIIAHEIGHHLDGHTLINEISKSNNAYQNWDKEWIADFFSGYILSKMGASLDEALSGVKKIIPEDFLGNNPNKVSHPDRYSRIVVIKNGYYKAKYFDLNINKGLQELIVENYKSKIIIEEKKLERLINGFDYKTNFGTEKKHYDFYRNLKFFIKDGQLIQKYTTDEENFIIIMPIRKISSVECLPIDNYININSLDKDIIQIRENKKTKKINKEILNGISIHIIHLSQPEMQEELSKAIYKLKILYSRADK